MLPILFLICRLESSYSPSTKEPEKKRRELFAMVSDQPNHEKELNKVRSMMISVLSALKSLHKIGFKNLPSRSLLSPAVFSPKEMIYHADNSVNLCEHKSWVVSQRAAAGEMWRCALVREPDWCSACGGLWGTSSKTGWLVLSTSWTNACLSREGTDYRPQEGFHSRLIW